MTENTKRIIGAVKTAKLGDLMDGWTDNCEVVVTTARYKEMAELKKMNPETMKEDEQIEFMLKFATDHFVAGTIMLYNPDTKQLEEAEATVDDIAELPIDMVGRIFETIMGQKFDPKDTAPVTTPTTAQPSSDTAEKQASSAAPTVTQ